MTELGYWRTSQVVVFAVKISDDQLKSLYFGNCIRHILVSAGQYMVVV